MIDLIAEMGPWSWIVVGLVLLGMEIFAPGTFFLWFGIAAIIVGFLSIMADLPWQLDTLLFLGIAGASLFVYFGWFRKRKNSESEEPMLNQRSERLVGMEFELIEPITNGAGRISIDDTVWRVNGPDLKEGVKVRVVESNGAILKVEPAIPEESTQNTAT